MDSIENHHSALRDFADYVLAETQRVRKLDSAVPKVETEKVVYRFRLAEYVQAMAELNGNQALSPDFINKRLESIRDDFYKFKNKIPQGVKCLVAIFPCNQNGTLYTNEEIKRGKQVEIFLIDPKTGLSLEGDTLAAMLPQEVHEKCSFIVEYQTNPSPFISQAEWTTFEAKLRTAYANLQSLLVNAKMMN